jgi:hypothetical protein
VEEETETALGKKMEFLKLIGAQLHDTGAPNRRVHDRKSFGRIFDERKIACVYRSQWSQRKRKLQLFLERERD